MAIRFNNKTLPISIFFEDKNGKPYYIEELWDSEKKINKNFIPDLKENANIGIRFHGDTENDYDEKAVCKIQTSLFNDLSHEEIKSYTMSKTKDTIHTIYKVKKDNNEDFPWRMGVYFIEVQYKGVKYFGGLNVTPHHLDRSQVDEVHNYLNEEVQGLIYDFVYSNKALTDDFDYDLPQYWYYDYARKLAIYFNDFMYAMSSIEKKPKDRIIPEYKPSLKQGKIDQKSVRWSYSNKGQATNGGSTYQQYTLNKKKIQSYNASKENQWLKNVLLLWEKDVLEVSSHIKEDINSIEYKLQEQLEELDELKNKQAAYNRKRDIARSQVNDISTRIYMINKEIQKSEQQLIQLQKWHDLLKKMENKLVFFLNNTYLKEVSRGLHKPFLKNFHYYRVDTLYNELKTIKEETGEQEQLKPILKPTWLIYEYYCLFKLANLLIMKGYTLIEGLDEDIVNLYFEDQIQEGTKFVFKKEDSIVHILYDHYHAGSKQTAQSRNEFFYITNPQKKPDIKVDFYKEKEEVVLLGTIVFDSKFSKLTDIYNPNYRNITTEQLSNYYHFFYSGKKERKGTVVDRVVCLYAGDDGDETEAEFEDILFVKFHPDKNSGQNQAIGEYQILNLIDFAIT